MTERPIILSAESVRAVLVGTKTQTRRVMKQAMERKLARRTIPDVADAVFPDGSGNGWVAWYGQGPFTAEDTVRRYPGDHGFHCPFGRPGDRLWVRETWHPAGRFGTEYLIEYNADESERTVDAGFEGPTPAIDAAISRNAWRSPIHMPRWASRLTLEVTGVRVERLQDITPDDARAEGHPHVPGTERYPQEVHDDAARDWFMDLWDGLNAKRGYPWESNPWVWVVEFRKAEP